MTTNAEAPVSVSTTIYYKGFSVMITKRDPDVKHERLIEDQLAMLDWLIDRGVKPSWDEETNKQALSEPVTHQENTERELRAEDNPSIPTCNMHNVKMKERTWPKGGTYYDHRREIDGVWNKCTGEGFKPDKPRS